MNPQHVAELKKGVEHWNEWYRLEKEENPIFTADLTGLSLEMEETSGPELWDRSAYRADLTGVFLNGAQLNEAKLCRVKFNGAELRGADLVGARMGGADFRGADICGADLTSADLRGTFGIQFDANQIRDVRLRWNCGSTWPNRSKWFPFVVWPMHFSWLVLQRAYSGSALIFNTILTVLFLAPYAVRAALWHSANRAQEAAGQLGVRIEQSLQGKEIPADVHAEIDSLKQMEPGGTDPGTTYYLWQVLLGVDRGWWPPILAVAVLLYNGIRWHLTSRVSWMRDEQERSGTTPAKADYWRLFLVHRWSIVLIALVVVSFAVNAVSWLGEEVWIPDWG